MRPWLHRIGTRWLNTRRRRGYAVAMLAVAVASVVTVTMSTQRSSGAYDDQLVTQMMHDERGKWLAEGFAECALSANLDPRIGWPNRATWGVFYQPPWPTYYNVGNCSNPGRPDLAERFWILMDWHITGGPMPHMRVQVLTYENQFYWGWPVAEKRIAYVELQPQNVPNSYYSSNWPFGQAQSTDLIASGRIKTPWRIVDDDQVTSP